MADLQRLARRIDTATELQSVVRTMKTLSAVGITQFERAAAAISAYLDTVEQGLQVALRARAGPFAATGETPGRTALVAVGSDFGLCGTFNEEIAERAAATLRAGEIEAGGLLVLTLGHRLEQHWSAEMPAPRARMELPSSVGQLGEAVGRIVRRLDAWQSEEGAGRILILHQDRAGDGRRAPRLVRVAPITGEELARIAGRPWPTRRLPMAQSAPGPLLGHFARERIFARIYAAAALSRATEHAARLDAMRAADRNIGEKLAALDAAYRHARQEGITTELLDVVAGFEAARSGP